MQTTRYTRPVLMSILGGTLLLSGCMAFQPEGPYWSADRYCYESHSWQPWTVTIIDTRTGQAVFSMDVPVGKELVFEFFEEDGDKVGDDFPSPIYPDKMTWDIWPKGQRYGDPRYSMSVPAAPHRRIDSKLRKVPELPPEMTGETGAADATSKP